MKMFICPIHWTHWRERFEPETMVSLVDSPADMDEVRPPWIRNHYQDFFRDIEREEFPGAPTLRQVENLIVWMRPQVHAYRVMDRPLAGTFGYPSDDPPHGFYTRDRVCRDLQPKGVWRRYDLGRVYLGRPSLTPDNRLDDQHTMTRGRESGISLARESRFFQPKTCGQCVYIEIFIKHGHFHCLCANRPAPRSLQKEHCCSRRRVAWGEHDAIHHRPRVSRS